VNLEDVCRASARVLHNTADTLDMCAEWWVGDAQRWASDGYASPAALCMDRAALLGKESARCRHAAAAALESISSAGGWGLSAPAQVNQGLMRSEPLPADDSLPPSLTRETTPQPTAADGSGPRHQTYTPAAAASI
jgi:hypothetical protein